MSINTRQPDSRKDVAWFERDLSDAAAFVARQRDLNLVKFSEDMFSDTNATIGLAAAVFFLDLTRKAQRTAKQIERWIPKLLDNGTSIVIMSGKGESGMLSNILDRLGLAANGFINSGEAEVARLSPSIQYYDRDTSIEEVLRAIAVRPIFERRNVGLAIDGACLDPSEEALVRRAFESRVVKVGLLEHRDGFSEARVFCAQVTGQGGSEIPFSVKILERSKAAREYNCYVEGIEPAVPFYLAPRLARERCCLGARKGIIVGHYVTESESLLSCIKTGRGVVPIACLFARTLRGCHGQQQSYPMETYLSTRLPRSEAFDERNINQAARLGLKRSVSSLLNHITGTWTTRAVYGNIHGDLHARNVRVRRSDAVVIDPSEFTTGLLAWDPASLEASLLVEGFAGDKRAGDLFLASVHESYRNNLFQFWGSEDAADQSSWFLEAIRHIRLYAEKMVSSERDYRIILAAALLRQGKYGVVRGPETYPGDGDQEEMRRGIALVLADTLLSGKGAR